MCARYSKAEIEALVQFRNEMKQLKLGPARYNICPRTLIPVLTAPGGDLTSHTMMWGWKPVWSKSLLINAQSESVTIKPTFKKHLHQRCLIPADGFYEWTPAKDPIRFTRPDRPVFMFAGLWCQEKNDQGELEPRALILTTAPNPDVAQVHNRMPFIVAPEHYDAWLDEGEGFQTVLPAPDRAPLQATMVSRALNKVGTEGAHLLTPEAPVKNSL